MPSVRVPFLDPVTDDAEAPAADERRGRSSRPIGPGWREDRGRFVANACIYQPGPDPPGAPRAARVRCALGRGQRVGVHPTHRRRGLLRRLMAPMLDGRPGARRGLRRAAGVGVGHLRPLRVRPRHHRGRGQHRQRPVGVRWRPPPELDLRLVDPDEATKVLPDLLRAAAAGRAGEPSRNAGVWEDYLEDRPHRRAAAASGLFVAVCDEGYVAYRVHDEDIMRGDRTPGRDRGAARPDAGGRGRPVAVRARPGPDRRGQRPSAGRSTTRCAGGWPTPASCGSTAFDDRLYLRILDVPAALEARGYRRAGRLVLDVLPPSDQLDGQPDPAPGRWVLEAGPGRGVLPAGPDRRGRRPAPGVAELGAIYLGGFPASVARRGRADRGVAGREPRPWPTPCSPPRRRRSRGTGF